MWRSKKKPIEWKVQSEKTKFIQGNSSIIITRSSFKIRFFLVLYYIYIYHKIIFSAIKVFQYNYLNYNNAFYIGRSQYINWFLSQTNNSILLKIHFFIPCTFLFTFLGLDHKESSVLNYFGHQTSKKWKIFYHP